MKITAILYLFLCFTLLFSTSASAYIDPSVTTYMIQIIAGVAIAIGAVVTVYWRKARKKVKDTLGIDDQAKKEVEEEIVVYQDNPKDGE